MDGDGRRDLIVVRQTDPIEWPKGNGWFVHLNITDGEPLVADINRDGFVDGADLGLLIAAWTG